MTVDSSQRLSSELTRMNWGLRKYDGLRVAVIFSIGRVVQTGEMLSKHGLSTFVFVFILRATQHNSEVAVKTES